MRQGGNLNSFQNVEFATYQVFLKVDCITESSIHVSKDHSSPLLIFNPLHLDITFVKRVVPKVQIGL